MRTPRIPKDEARRLAALRALQILDTAREERFDRITRLAQELFRVPIAVVSLVDSEREWFKSCQGLTEREGPRSISFCGHTILGDETFVVTDAAKDPRFARNPMVLESPHIRFYAGHPIKSPDGSRVGALCIKDRRPRRLGEAKLELLRALAAMVETEMRLIEIAKLQREVEKRIAAERRLQERHEQFFTLSLDLLCIAGFDGYFKQLNPSWHKTLGYTLEELKARPFLDFVHPEDRAATETEAARIGDGHATVHFENRYRHKRGGHRWLHWTAAPATNGQRIYAVARDVTELKRMETQLRDAKDEAEGANRAKSEFLANMSHELRTPLNSVIGFSNILLKNKGGNLRPEETGFLERIRDNGKHLLELINEVLDISKIEAGQMDLEITTLCAATVVEETLAQLEGAAREKGIALEADVPDGLVPIRADAVRLKQVLINLVANAVKFTEDGQVVVRVVPEAGTARVRRFEVRDSGIGIPENKLAEIFEAFRQADASTSRRYGGTGLGLTISRSLCRLMGFDLGVSSEPGVGSTFWIELHAASAVEPTRQIARDAVDVGAISCALGSVAADDPTVLVIDDEEDSRLLLAEHLRDLGCRVLTASSGQDGLRLARARRPDLITLDLMMPGLNGWDVLKLLKSDDELENVPVVVVSIVAREKRATVFGAVDAIDKPVDKAALRRAIERNLTQRVRRVMIVDDDPDARRIQAELVAEHGAEVVEAVDGADALRRLGVREPDLILLDLMMPGMDGITFLAELRKHPRRPNIPVIVVTASDARVEELRRLDDRVLAVIHKGEPLQEELEGVLARTLGRGNRQAV